MGSLDSEQRRTARKRVQNTVRQQYDMWEENGKGERGQAVKGPLYCDFARSIWLDRLLIRFGLCREVPGSH